jgi:hypothetical protein
MSDILGVSEEFLTDEFLSNPDNLNLVEQAMNGST